MSPIERIHGAGNQEVGTEVVLLAVACSVPVGDFVFSVPAPLNSAGLVVLFTNVGAVFPWGT